MKFLSYSLLTDQAIARFNELALTKKDLRFNFLKEKMDLCDYEILLISFHYLNLDQLEVGWDNPEIIKELNMAWRNILVKGPTDLSIMEKAWFDINRIGEPLSTDFQENDNVFIKKFRHDPTGKHYFILLNTKETYGLPTHDLIFLCNLWQIEQGYTPIHSASIIHHEKLYLFCGPHGSGKSTIAEMSKQRNDTILDQDIVLIPGLSTTNFIARAWGYSTQTSNAPLRAIIKIIQDSENRLIPLTQAQTAHYLVERSIEVLGNILHDQMMEKLFHQVSEISRSVPGYELHFHKSPDFWKLIDEQIPA